jgi:hypothetical protein
MRTPRIDPNTGTLSVIDRACYLACGKAYMFKTTTLFIPTPTAQLRIGLSINLDMNLGNVDILIG